MRKTWILSLGILGLMACNTQMPSAMLPSPEERIERQQEAKLDPETKVFTEQVQLQMEAGSSLEAFVTEMASEEGITLQLLDEIPGRNIYLFEYHSRKDFKEVVQSLRADSRVRKVGRNRQIQVDSVALESSDPQLNLQWALRNFGQDAPGALGGTKDSDINFNLEDTPGSAEVVVAIVDTGIEYTHEDLAIVEERDGKKTVVGGNIWINPEERADGKNSDNNGNRSQSFVDDLHGYDFVNLDGDPMDDHGHGTHVAGVIGALRDNMKGIAGMNAKVSMMGVKFLSAGGGGSTFAAESAIYYVIDKARRFPEKRWIMNHSWGSSGRGTEDGLVDDFLMMAFEESAEAGIFNAAAAGNAAESNRFLGSFPSNYARDIPGFVSVAATNNLDQIAEFSSYGYGYVDVAAPGVMIQSTILNNQYDAWSGTSMATPHVAGLAALIWAAEPGLSANEVKERILSTVDILPQLEGLVTTGGRINVGRALANDFNVKTPEALVEVIPYREESPRLRPGFAMDYPMTIEHPGAKSIQVCFSRIHLENPFDWIQVYGDDYRIRDLITGRHSARRWEAHRGDELCTAPVSGERVHLRLFTDFLPEGAAGFTGFSIESLRVVR